MFAPLLLASSYPQDLLNRLCGSHEQRLAFGALIKDSSVPAQLGRATLDRDPLLRKGSGRRQVRPENQAESQLIRRAIFSRRLLSQIKNRDRLVCEVASVRLPAEASAAACILSMHSLISAR